MRDHLRGIDAIPAGLGVITLLVHAFMVVINLAIVILLNVHLNVHGINAPLNAFGELPDDPLFLLGLDLVLVRL